MTRSLWLGLWLGISVAVMAEIFFSREQSFSGMCDASAAIAVDGARFVVADDESTLLRTYSIEKGGPPESVIDLAQFLKIDPKNPESDLEGAAQLDDLVYWIGSHARNKNGKERPNRQRFFATRIDPSGRITPVGQPYSRLLVDLCEAPELKPYDLVKASQLAPKLPGALNIEGLASGKNGSLIIGFRNPIPKGKALLVRLQNPRALIEGKEYKARFGAPIELDLAGDGIRSILGHEGEYYIAAGSADGERRSSIWKWDGNSKPTRLWQAGNSNVNLEALFELNPGSTPVQLFVLSDEGSTKIKGQECKDLPPAQRGFRGFQVVTR